MKKKFISLFLILFILLGVEKSYAQGIGNGDVNGDGKIDIQDIKLILQNWLNTPTGNQDQYADNKLNSFDTTVVIKLIPTGTPVISPSTVPVNTPTPTVSLNDPVLAAAGDSVCGTADIGQNLPCKDKETAAVIKQINPVSFLALGDEQYESGSYSDFLKYYDSPVSWGQFKPITHPVPGNHEYGTPGAAGYFQYFGASAGPTSKGYYSFDIGAWHVVALNSECTDPTFDSGHGCDAGSLQELWLKSDLATHSNKCTLAFMHRPYFTSGTKDTPQLKPIYADLFTYKADLILTGHKHMYEQFAPQDINLNPDPVNGIREIVVGTGGRDLTGVPNITYPNLEVRNGVTFGVLRLILHPNGYDWKFMPIAGQTFTSSGSGVCH